MRDALSKQLDFLIEVDKLKSVVRQSPLINRSRRENSAEHSWHLALFALVLLRPEDEMDLMKIVTMLLIHDIVEIDAGDAPIHGSFDATALAAAEEAASERLFNILPDKQAAMFKRIWAEFEAAESREARFAKSLDRLQPLLLNTLTGGGTWTENGVGENQVYERYGPTINRGAPRLWEEAQARVRSYFAQARSGGEIPA